MYDERVQVDTNGAQYSIKDSLTLCRVRKKRDEFNQTLFMIQYMKIFCFDTELFGRIWGGVHC